MTSVVEPLFKPDAALMHTHLTHLFGGHSEGFIELSWTTDKPDADGRYKLAFSEWFAADEIDHVIQRAVEINSRPMVNVYVGAGLRRPDSVPNGRSHDSDAWKLTAAYVDLDDPDSVAVARSFWSIMKPTLIVGTGRDPHLRAQAYWKLTEPLTDHGAWSALLRAFARTLKGDKAVFNPGRVLRLAGSVAWPQKPGRNTELTFIGATTGEPPPRLSYDVKSLAAYFRYDPALDAVPAAAPPIDEVVTHSTNTLGLADKIDDGREKYMTRMLFAAFITYCGENGAAPSAEELVAEVWPVYERKVDLTRPGRGIEEMRHKARYLVHRFERGELRGLADLDDVIAAYGRKKVEAAAEYAAADFGGEDQSQAKKPVTTIKTVDFLTLLTEEVVEEPDYIEPGFAGPGNFVLIAGPPKAQKSFLLQEMLVACATGTSFLINTFKVPRPLRVFYLQAEMNRKLLRKRAREMRFLTDDQRELLATNLISSERFHVLLDKDGVNVAVSTIKSSFPDEPPDIIAIDPLANIYDQESESDNAQMMRFLTTRVERIRQAVNPLAAIVMAHHATKAKAEDMARDPFTCIRGAGSLRGYYDSAIVVFRKNEESKTRRMHFELRSSESPDPVEVELVGGRFERAAKAQAEIDKPRAVQLLKAIDEAWGSGRALSSKTQTKTEGRYAPMVLSKRFGVDPKAVEDLLHEWLINGIVGVEVYDRKTKARGLCVLEWLD